MKGQCIGMRGYELGLGLEGSGLELGLQYTKQKPEPKINKSLIESKCRLTNKMSHGWIELYFERLKLIRAHVLRA